MPYDKCNVGVNPHGKKGWEAVFRGDCDELLDDIDKNLGPYGRKYWEDHHIYHKQPRKPQPSQEMVPQEPPTTDASTDTAE